MELSESNTPEIEPLLSTMDARILGALMEKQLTTPDAYPLTLNSVVLACNQKTNREPTSNYDQGEVQRCLSALQDRKLIEVDYGTRAARYGQRLTRVISVDKATQALLNVMLLRGPQTLSELLLRTQRMFEFANLHAVKEKMDYLCAKSTPVVMHIPRMQGQREDRYMHLLSGAPDLLAIATMLSSSKSNSSNAEDERISTLEQKIESLESQVSCLRQHVKVLMDLNGVSEADMS
jgi:uncharacterized protein